MPFQETPVHICSLNPSQENKAWEKALRDFLKETWRIETTADIAQADLIITLGGDGSLLHALRHTHSAKVRFLALHTGHMGFFATTREPDTFISLLSQALRRELVETRLPRYTIRVHQAGASREHLCVNDFLLEKTMTWLKSSLRTNQKEGHRLIRHFHGSGVVGITPLGSTTVMAAHNQSPILDPDLSMMYLKGINERNQPAQGLVVSLQHQALHLTLDEVETNYGIPEADRHPPRLYIDGIQYGEMHRGDWLEAKPSTPAILLRRADDHWARIYGSHPLTSSFFWGIFVSIRPLGTLPRSRVSVMIFPFLWSFLYRKRSYVYLLRPFSAALSALNVRFAKSPLACGPMP